MKKTELQKEIKSYLKPAKKLLKCSRHSKKTFYEAVKTSMEEFLDIRPEASREELLQFLGLPQDLVLNFVAELDLKEVESARRRSKLITCGIITGVFLLCLAVTLFYFYANSAIQVYEYYL